MLRFLFFPISIPCFQCKNLVLLSIFKNYAMFLCASHTVCILFFDNIYTRCYSSWSLLWFLLKLPISVIWACLTASIKLIFTSYSVLNPNYQ